MPNKWIKNRYKLVVTPTSMPIMYCGEDQVGPETGGENSPNGISSFILASCNGGRKGELVIKRI